MDVNVDHKPWLEKMTEVEEEKKQHGEGPSRTILSSYLDLVISDMADVAAPELGWNE